MGADGSDTHACACACATCACACACACTFPCTSCSCACASMRFGTFGRELGLIWRLAPLQPGTRRAAAQEGSSCQLSITVHERCRLSTIWPSGPTIRRGPIGLSGGPPWRQITRSPHGAPRRCKANALLIVHVTKSVQCDAHDDSPDLQLTC
jgi:hypothetical protein